MLLVRADLGEGRPLRPCYEASFVIDRSFVPPGLSAEEVFVTVGEANHVLWEQTPRSRLCFRLPPPILTIVAVLLILSSSGEGFMRIIQALIALTLGALCTSALHCHLARQDNRALLALQDYLTMQINPRWLPRALCWKLTSNHLALDAGEEDHPRLFLGLFALDQHQHQRQHQHQPQTWECIVVPRNGEPLPVATYVSPPGGAPGGGGGGGGAGGAGADNHPPLPGGFEGTTAFRTVEAKSPFPR